MRDDLALEARLCVAAIGGGDIDAVAQIIGALPERPGLAVIVACAGSPALAERLRASSPIPVIDVNDSVQLENERIYVLPPNREASIQRHALVLEDPDGRSGLDRLFRSMAASLGRDSAAVIVGGRGTEGALGIKSVKEAGGLTICQAVDHEPDGEMPRNAIATGMVDLVLPLSEIPKRLVALTAESDDLGPVADDIKPPERTADTLRDILTMVRIRTGHDFGWYKRATLYRRVSRRMQVCQSETISEYHRYLRDHPGELSNLLRDFLISVTSFFRDYELYEALSTKVIPKLFHAKTAGDQVRVWVAGCASGEEAYSVGMLLLEHAAAVKDPPQLQVFATDIDEDALTVARAGVYPEMIRTDVSPQRLDRFFTRENDHYRVNKELREMMLFSPHNLLRDPPFSRLDLVSCRNLLIYLNREAQDRVLNLFHFGLRPEGNLFLGSSESAENNQQFASLDVKNRLFTRRPAATAITSDGVVTAARWTPTRAPAAQTIEHERTGLPAGELHHRIVEQYAPPSVLVNEDLNVVHISQHAGRFLTVIGGEPTRELLRIVHPALAFELRSAIYAARQQYHAAQTRVVKFDEAGRTRVVEVRVRAVDLPDVATGTMLVTFDELDGTNHQTVVSPDPKIEPVVREMEEELHRTRDQLRTTVEQYETSVEELKASNEELQAINEELRSATEELETSKEELQSVNEELTTLNHELKVKIDEVSRANSDLQNLMTSTDIGVLFLDRQMHIKRFTPRTQDLFNLIPTDIGRPLSHVTHRLESVDLTEMASRVLQTLRVIECDTRTKDGKRFLTRFLPYRSLDDRIDGVVVTFIDVTDVKLAEEARDRSEAALRTTEERLVLALRSAPIAVLAHDGELATTWAFVQGKELDSAVRASVNIFATGHADRYATIAREVLQSGTGQRAELDVAIDGQLRTYDFRIEPSRNGKGIVGITAVGFDITPSKLAETSLRDADRRKDEFLATLSHELRNPLTPLRVAFDVARMSTHGSPEAAQALSIMDRQIHLLVRLIDDLLDLSRITQGKIQLEMSRIDPVRLVEAALEATRPLIEEAGHHLTVELPKVRTVVRGDFTRLTQVLSNLLSNASKYTPNGGHIKLLLNADTRRNVLALQVADNGVGIDAELLPRVFEIFVQSRDDLGRSKGGLGIGLNLVRRIVELHGGTATAASDGPGKGSMFTIELPLVDKD